MAIDAEFDREMALHVARANRKSRADARGDACGGSPWMVYEVPERQACGLLYRANPGPWIEGSLHLQVPEGRDNR